MDPELTLLPGFVRAADETLTLFRYCSYDVPFWARANTRPGRWHRVGQPATQYWSASPDAAWAELIRAECLHEERDVAQLRMAIWVCRVNRQGLVDLTDPVQQDAHGVDERQLVDPDWSACQRLGSELRERFRGLLAPCAALPGHVNVTLFGARRAIEWSSVPALASAVPAAVVAVGQPRPGLVELVSPRPDDPQRGLRLF